MQHLPLLVVACLVFGGCCSPAQSNTRNDDQAPAWRFQLPAAGSPSEDRRTPKDIKIEDDYFDSHCGASDPIGGPQRMVGGHSGHASFDEDFPVRFRDEVVVAHFTTWSTHLSSSRHSIYTIVNLQIDRIVADKDGHKTEGSVISLAVPGGTVLDPAPITRPVLSYCIQGKDFPLEPNIKYLIFLNHQPTLPFYVYMKAWNVDKGALEPTTAFDAYRISQGRSSHAGKSLKSAINELSSH
jgi:hypothetical protein